MLSKHTFYMKVGEAGKYSSMYLLFMTKIGVIILTLLGMWLRGAPLKLWDGDGVSSFKTGSLKKIQTNYLKIVGFKKYNGKLKMWYI